MIGKMPEDGVCDNDDCTEPTPWDMMAIHLGEEWVCSLDCARSYLDTMDTAPETISFHDPQHSVSRETFVDVPTDAVGVTISVDDIEETKDAIDELDDIIDIESRPS